MDCGLPGSSVLHYRIKRWAAEPEFSNISSFRQAFLPLIPLRLVTAPLLLSLTAPLWESKWQILFSWAPKSLQTVTAAINLKHACSLEGKLDSVLKHRTWLVEKGPYGKSYGLSTGHVWMWELDHKEGRILKNWCFWIVVLEKTLESPLDSKEIKPVNPKGNQSWIFIGRTDAEAKAPILWPPDAKNWLIGKDPDAGKDWRQKDKGETEDEMVGWHHWLNGHGFEQTLGDSGGQRILAGCSPGASAVLIDFWMGAGRQRGQAMIKSWNFQPYSHSLDKREGLEMKLVIVHAYQSTCQCRRHKWPRFDPWVRKIPWRRKWQLAPVFLPGELHGHRSLKGYSPGGCKESDTTECTHTHTYNVMKHPWNPNSVGFGGFPGGLNTSTYWESEACQLHGDRSSCVQNPSWPCLDNEPLHLVVHLYALSCPLIHW